MKIIFLQCLERSMLRLLPLMIILLPTAALAELPIDLVRVIKSEHKLQLLSSGIVQTTKSVLLAVLLFIHLGDLYAAESNNPVKTIQEFYKRYMSYDYHKTPALPRPKLEFSKSFGDAVKNNSKICAKYATGPCGWASDGDEYLDTQESYPNLNYKNSGITIKEIKPNIIQVKLNVYPSVKNAKGYYEKTIIYKMISENGSWVVDDVTYSDGVSSRKHMTDENTNAITHPDPDSPAGKMK